MDFLTLILGFAGATALYLSLTKLRDLYRLFREYYVLWNVAIGGRGDRRTISTRLRLHAYVCKTKLLDEVSVNQIFSFLMDMIDSDVTVQQFHKILLSYSFVFLCRERMDGSLRGVMLFAVDKKEQDGKKFTLIRLGLAFFQRNYQGGPIMYYVTLYHILKELLLHPQTPLYVIGKAFSYKSYLVLNKALATVYPRYDAKTPDFEQKLIDNFAAEIAMKGDVYCPERCVIERKVSSIKDFVAPLTSQELQNPHILFFKETNPGWQEGHQLITVGRITWRDLLYSLYKAVTRARTARHEGATQTKKKRAVLSRQFSFQSEEAKVYVKRHSDSLLATLNKEDKDFKKQQYFTQKSFKIDIHL